MICREPGGSPAAVDSFSDNRRDTIARINSESGHNYRPVRTREAYETLPPLVGVVNDVINMERGFLPGAAPMYAGTTLRAIQRPPGIFINRALRLRVPAQALGRGQFRAGDRHDGGTGESVQVQPVPKSRSTAPMHEDGEKNSVALS